MSESSPRKRFKTSVNAVPANQRNPRKTEITVINKSLVNFISEYPSNSYLIATTHALLSLPKLRDFLSGFAPEKQCESLVGHFQNLSLKMWGVQLGSLKPGGLL
jgi:hypothetical protein